MLRYPTDRKAVEDLAPPRIDDINPVRPEARDINARQIMGRFRADTIGARLAVQVLRIDDRRHAGKHIDFRTHGRRGSDIQREDERAGQGRPDRGRRGRYERPPAPAPDPTQQCHASAQLLRQGGDRRVDQRAAAALIDLGGDDLARRGDRRIDRRRTDLSGGAGLGLGDALLGQALAPRQRLFEIAGRLRREPLGFLPGVRDDCLRLGRRLAFLTPIIGQQLFCFLAQPARLVEFVADADRALVECAGDRAGSPASRPRRSGSPARSAPRNGDRAAARSSAACPGENVVDRRGQPRLARARRRSAFRRPTGRHRPRCRAPRRAPAALVAAMRRSASSICWASAAARARWRSAASAASRSEVSFSTAWACARASAIVRWNAALAASASAFSWAARARSSSRRCRRASIAAVSRGSPIHDIST